MRFLQQTSFDFCLVLITGICRFPLYPFPWNIGQECDQCRTGLHDHGGWDQEPYGTPLRRCCFHPGGQDQPQCPRGAKYRWRVLLNTLIGTLSLCIVELFLRFPLFPFFLKFCFIINFSSTACENGMVFNISLHYLLLNNGCIRCLDVNVSILTLSCNFSMSVIGLSVYLRQFCIWWKFSLFKIFLFIYLLFAFISKLYC